MHQLSTFTTTFDNIKQNNLKKKKKTQQYQYLNFVDDFMGSHISVYWTNTGHNIEQRSHYHSILAALRHQILKPLLIVVCHQIHISKFKLTLIQKQKLQT